MLVRLCELFSTPIPETIGLVGIVCRALVEKLCITLRIAWRLGVDGGFQGCCFMGAEVSLDGLWVVVQIVDPCVVTLLLSLIGDGISVCKKGGDGLPFFFCPRVEQDLLDFGKTRFDAAQTVVEGGILLRHFFEERMVS